MTYEWWDDPPRPLEQNSEIDRPPLNTIIEVTTLEPKKTPTNKTLTEGWRKSDDAEFATWYDSPDY